MLIPLSTPLRCARDILMLHVTKAARDPGSMPHVAKAQCCRRAQYFSWAGRNQGSFENRLQHLEQVVASRAHSEHTERVVSSGLVQSTQNRLWHQGSFETRFEHGTGGTQIQVRHCLL